MFKVMWLLRRKAGITHEQFRDHYERSHALLGQKYLGHLLIEYRRNYRTETWGRVQPGGRLGPMDWTHDCVTEWVMPNREAFEEVTRILADPVIGREFHEDEEHFLDRDSVFLVMCDPVDTGTGLAMPARQAGPVG